MTSSEDIAKLDLYEILGVPSDATDKEISKAYRKAALKCHPDKNPDKKAHEEFKRLGKILDLLCDPAKRAAYDQGWKAKKAAAERVLQMDSKRRKLREDLEEKERLAAEKLSGAKVRDSSAKLSEKERVEKLREEGHRLLESERLHGSSRRKESHLNKFIKAKWDPVHPDHASYNEAELLRLFRKYGDVVSVKMIGKSTAIIEFASRDSALHSMQELGHVENPLDLDLLDDSELPPAADNVRKTETPPLKRPAPTPAPVVNYSADFEAETLSRLMAAAAQKSKKDSA